MDLGTILNHATICDRYEHFKVKSDIQRTVLNRCLAKVQGNWGISKQIQQVLRHLKTMFSSQLKNVCSLRGCWQSANFVVVTAYRFLMMLRYGFVFCSTSCRTWVSTVICRRTRGTRYEATWAIYLLPFMYLGADVQFNEIPVNGFLFPACISSDDPEVQVAYMRKDLWPWPPKSKMILFHVASFVLKLRLQSYPALFREP